MRSNFRTTGLDDLSAVEFANVLELWGVVSDPELEGQKMIEVNRQKWAE